MAEKTIGTVTHWYDKISVAVVKLTAGLKVGDRIKVRHGETETEDTVGSMQIDHADVQSGKKGDEVAIKLAHKAKAGSVIVAAE